jgi:endonuclease YncB( thermonuclease family)
VNKKNTMLGLGLLTLVSLGGTYYKMKMVVPAYGVARVIDGDTFETAEKQLIRLADVDTPETELCGSEEAKKELEKLVLNKPVYLKVIYRDKFMRLISYVYTPQGFVNAKMAETGNAIYRLSGQGNSESVKIKNFAEIATANKSGIFGKKCTQITNMENPKCVIKGNARIGENTKIYSIPGCESYASTLIQLYLGDQWFCTEAEAKKAGFTKAGGCN